MKLLTLILLVFFLLLPNNNSIAQTRKDPSLPTAESKETMSKIEHEYCLSNRSTIYTKTYDIERKKYCNCIKNKFLEKLKEHKGKLTKNRKNGMRVLAIVYCRKPKSY